jgi:hypothetical protein
MIHPHYTLSQTVWNDSSWLDSKLTMLTSRQRFLQIDQFLTIFAVEKTNLVSYVRSHWNIITMLLIDGLNADKRVETHFHSGILLTEMIVEFFLCMKGRFPGTDVHWKSLKRDHSLHTSRKASVNLMETLEIRGNIFLEILARHFPARLRQ